MEIAFHVIKDIQFKIGIVCFQMILIRWILCVEDLIGKIEYVLNVHKEVLKMDKVFVLK